MAAGYDIWDPAPFLMIQGRASMTAGYSRLTWPGLYPGKLITWQWDGLA